MSNNDPYTLGDLDKQDAWRLFQTVGFRQQPEPRLDRIGREIAKLCGNVPLVLRVIGGLLREKATTVEAWSNFRNDLGSRSCCDRESSIMHILKLSYDQLYPKGLKRCFLHFSVFPKGFRIKENVLIYQWRALGFVEKQENQSEMDAAQEYFLCLLNRGLLLHLFWPIVQFTMHGVIHDLAISLAKSKYKRVEYDECDFSDETQHVSITRTAKCLKEGFPCPSLFHIKDQLRSLLLFNLEHPLDLKGLSKFRQLRAFTLFSCVQEAPSTIGKLIHLKYLDLSHNSFTKLPDSITQLVNLVYLNLDQCYGLQKLPSELCKLEDLEFLNLQYCRDLQELPRDISKLEKLWHLELFGCHSLKHMPSELGKLTCLQTLSLFVVSGHSWINEDVSGIADLNSLNNLKGRLEIVVNGCCLPPSEVKAANLQAKEKLGNLIIEFKGGSNADSEVLEQFRPPSNLTSLAIKGYKGRTPPSWIDDRDRFLNLEELEIDDWGGISCLGSSVKFPRLTFLRIMNCKNMEYIIESPATSTIESNDDSSASSFFFPRLEELIIEDIPKLKGLRRNCISNSSGSSFPKLVRLLCSRVGLETVPEEFWGLRLLYELEFNNCEQLKEISEWIDTFQSLEILIIRNCPRLISLPKQLFNLTNLKSLLIQNCPNIKARSRGKDRCFMLGGAGGSSFPKLECLRFVNVGLECFPEEFRGLPLLNSIHFNHCGQLEKIPEWIDTFPSLRKLTIDHCHTLKSLPKQIVNLTNLEELYIIDCPSLAERCQRQTGEDWPLIQHILHIHIDPEFESQRFSPVL